MLKLYVYVIELQKVLTFPYIFVSGLFILLLEGFVLLLLSMSETFLHVKRCVRFSYAALTLLAHAATDVFVL